MQERPRRHNHDLKIARDAPILLANHLDPLSKVFVGVEKIPQTSEIATVAWTEIGGNEMEQIEWMRIWDFRSFLGMTRNSKNRQQAGASNKQTYLSHRNIGCESGLSSP